MCLAASSQPDASDPAAINQLGTTVVASTLQDDQYNGNILVIAEVPGVFSSEVIRPNPKAGPKNISKAGRKKRKFPILTDALEKNALEEELIMEKVKKVEKPKVKNTKKKKRGSKKILLSNLEVDEYICLVCYEQFHESMCGENWIQCQICKQ